MSSSTTTLHAVASPLPRGRRGWTPSRNMPLELFFPEEQEQSINVIIYQPPPALAVTISLCTPSKEHTKLVDDVGRFSDPDVLFWRNDCCYFSYAKSTKEKTQGRQDPHFPANHYCVLSALSLCSSAMRLLSPNKRENAATLTTHDKKRGTTLAARSQATPVEGQRIELLQINEETLDTTYSIRPVARDGGRGHDNVQGRNSPPPT